MKTILVTGFESFGGESLNPSYEAADRLPRIIDGVNIVVRKLPVSYNDAGKVLRMFCRELNPDAVVCLGQAGGRCGITPELVAINYMYAKIADNDGIIYDGVKIYDSDPDAYFTTLPYKKMLESMRKCAVPCELSTTAGAYVCNRVMFEAMKISKERGIPAGFIHVPYMREQVADKNGVFSMELSEITHALELCTKEIINII